MDYDTICEDSKVKTLLEGRKIWKKSPTCFDKQQELFLLNSVKTSKIVFQIFVAFSEKLDFTTNLFGQLVQIGQDIRDIIEKKTLIGRP